MDDDRTPMRVRVRAEARMDEREWAGGENSTNPAKIRDELGHNSGRGRRGRIIRRQRRQQAGGRHEVRREGKLFKVTGDNNIFIIFWSKIREKSKFI